MASDAQKAKDQYELYRYCREEGGHERFLRDADVAKQYYASKQWTDSDERSRTAEGRLSFVVNEIFRTINTVRGELAQLSSDVRFDATNGDPEVARVLNKLNEHVDRENKMFLHDDRVMLDGLLTGRGYYRMRVGFDDNLQGNIKIARIRPENVVLDYDLDSPDPESWNRVFTTEVVSLDDIKNMFGRKVPRDFGAIPYADWLELEDRSLAQSLGISVANHADLGDKHKHHRLISQQWREYKYKDCFVDPITGDISEVPESWPREKISAAVEMFDLAIMRRKVKTIRWRVTVNDHVMHEDDSPYKHFDIVPYFPWFVDNVPLSLFNVLKGPQDLLNYTVNEETHILGTTSHSGWKIKQGSLKNMTARQLEEKGSKSGLVMELEDPSDAERITPGQPATGFERFGDRARQWINDLAAVSPAMLGQSGQYQSGKGVSANLQRAPVNLHTPLVMFQYTKQLLAERKLYMFQNFYTETRILRVASSPYGPAEELAINVPDAAGQIMHDLTVGMYSVRMMPVGSRLAAEEFGFDQLVAMKELGINVPNSLLVVHSAVNAKADTIEALITANGGDTNPLEERAKELDLERVELENEGQRALVESHLAAADLSRGRAARAYMEAKFDPRVTKAQLDAMRLEAERERDQGRLTLESDKAVRGDAIKMAQMALQQEQAEKDRAVQKAAPKKTAAKKVAKKAAKKTARRTTRK